MPQAYHSYRRPEGRGSNGTCDWKNGPFCPGCMTTSKPFRTSPLVTLWPSFHQYKESRHACITAYIHSLIRWMPVALPGSGELLEHTAALLPTELPVEFSEESSSRPSPPSPQTWYLECMKSLLTNACGLNLLPCSRLL